HSSQHVDVEACLWSAAYLYPARSASRVAAAWNSPAAATLVSSCLNLPHLARIGLNAAWGLAGYSILESAKSCWASGLVRNSMSLTASARFFPWAVNPAPEIFTCGRVSL